MIIVYDNSTTKVQILHFKYHFHQKQNVSLFKTRRLNVIGNVATKSKVNQYEILFQYETNIFLTLISFTSSKLTYFALT